MFCIVCGCVFRKSSGNLNHFADTAKILSHPCSVKTFNDTTPVGVVPLLPYKRLFQRGNFQRGNFQRTAGKINVKGFIFECSNHRQYTPHVQISCFGSACLTG